MLLLTPPQKTDVRKGVQQQYPHPDLEGETSKLYLKLTKELRWLDKKLAYKVVKSVPAMKLCQRIGRVSAELQAGRPIKPAVHFESLLASKINKPGSQEEGIPDPEASIRGACCRILAGQLGVSLLLTNRIILQIPPNTLKSALEKISQEVQTNNICNTANYVLERLKEEHKLSI